MRMEEYRLLASLIEERAGLQFGPDQIRQLERRLRPRLAALGFGSFAEYHRHLRYHADGEEELQQAYDLVTNKETYFFREDYQLQCFRDEIIPRLLRDAGHRRHFACWSMGCSTGEEAYSIAVLLLEAGSFEGWSLRVYGTDLSRRCVTAARRGIYGESSFRSTSPDRKALHFVTTRNGAKVAPAVRELCQFGQHNLIKLAERSTIDQVDAIFCRNVLIYFSAEARKRVIEAIYERLRPGGFLMLGHSESLLNEDTRFEPLQLARDVVYRRPVAGARPRGTPARGGPR